MALVTSGNQLHLQGTSDTNPTTTTQPVLLNQTLTTGLDGLFQMQQLDEIGDGQFIPVTIIQGDAYGYWSGAFNTGSYVHTQFSYGSGIGGYRYNGLSTFGSLTNSFTDGGGTTRVISAIWWSVPDASPINVKTFVFALNGTGISNSDTTFNKIEIITNGGTTVTINRSDLSYDSSENGDTWWYMSGNSSSSQWTTISNLGTPSSGTSYTIKVYGASTTTTSNTGIAEEFGGADSADVKMSDYYKGASSGFVNTGTGTANIPTSGNPIAFSDFYGASYVSGIISAVTIQPAVKYDTNTGPRGGQYEFICHGLGAASHSTYSSGLLGYNSPVNTTHLTDSFQGSLVGATHPINNFGVSSAIGILRTITHFTYGPAGTTGAVMLVIGNTGSDSNSGFTNLVATRSGMTTLTLPRSSATYLYQSGDNGTRIWRWNESQVAAIANYDTGTPSSQNVDSILFPGGSGTNNSSGSTTTTSRTTWTIS